MNNLFTKLPYKVRHADYLEEIFEDCKAVQEEGKELYFGFLDGDGLKQINTNFGHIAGNECIYIAVKIILASIRYQDELIRYGGDEFVLLLNNASKENYTTVFSRIQSQLKDNEVLKNFGGFTFSMGVTKYEKGSSIRDVTTQADKALYEAKQIKNCIVYKELDCVKSKSKKAA